MKPEPLKDKLVCGTCWMHNCGHTRNVFCRDDIKLAVEWLKEEIDLTNKSGASFEYNDIIETIDKAFEDVTKCNKQ